MLEHRYDAPVLQISGPQSIAPCNNKPLVWVSESLLKDSHQEGTIVIREGRLPDLRWTPQQLWLHPRHNFRGSCYFVLIF